MTEEEAEIREDIILGLKILKLEEEDSILASKIMTKLKVDGKIINDLDTLIAAQAIRKIWSW